MILRFLSRMIQKRHPDGRISIIKYIDTCTWFLLLEVVSATRAVGTSHDETINQNFQIFIYHQKRTTETSGEREFLESSIFCLLIR